MDVAVLVTDGVSDLGLSAVLEVFTVANSLLPETDPEATPWRVRTISQGESVRTAHEHLVPTLPLARCETADILVVPAMLAMSADRIISRVSDPVNRPVLEHISAARSHGTQLAAACTGTFQLAEAGVLDGLRATTNWTISPQFRKRYPKVEVVEAYTVYHADGVTTAGAAIAHLDLALALIARLSPDTAQLAGRYLLAGDRRRQSVVPEVVARGDSLVVGFQRWVAGHVGEQFQIADVARELGVTPRSLQRATHDELGMSPKEFVDEIRLERATQLLHTTSMTVESIAGRVGYLNPGTLRTLFRRRRGRTISEVRASSVCWASDVPGGGNSADRLLP
ncbi:GlxA family transcriptional regulator [Nocardia yamanashiensis]|uniref:GlxA family transcriptional regulator n=1 Tax=Nocardia yamanashiensis TaxID=209247 RepID=UPI000832592D|nr:helix-turn-helix domain-containing protein [Nocardia yamanashiensis]